MAAISQIFTISKKSMIFFIQFNDIDNSSKLIKVIAWRPNRRQADTRTNVDQDTWRHKASQKHGR